MTSDPGLENLTIGPLPDWGPDAAGQLLEVLWSRDAPFPCTFAVAGARKETLRFGFVADLDLKSSWQPLPEILREYLKIYQELSRETSLVVFFGDSGGARDLAEYNAKFWSVMQFLHDQDEEPWPGGTPTDPDDPLWEFSFAGTQIFVVCNNPAHEQRASRHSPGFMITFQPRWVFEGLEPESPRGAAARKVIRKRLVAYDQQAPAAELGGFGDPDNREWQQYFLPDTNNEPPMGCPFHAKAMAAPHPDRLVLLIHGLPAASGAGACERNILDLRERCQAMGVPVVCTGESLADSYDIPLADASGWDRLRDILHEHGRDQLAVSGLHAGTDSPFAASPRTFLVTDAISKPSFSDLGFVPVTTGDFLAQLEKADGSCSS